MIEQRFTRNYSVVTAAVAVLVSFAITACLYAESLEGKITKINRNSLTIDLGGPVSYAAGEKIDITYTGGGMMEFLIGTYKVTETRGNILVAELIRNTMPPSEGMNVRITQTAEITYPPAGYGQQMPQQAPPRPPQQTTQQESQQTSDEAPESAPLQNNLFSPDYGKKTPINIKGIQLKLKELGYTPGNTDGTMDEQTANAIRHYQEEKNMVIDGKPSHELYDALYGEANGFDQYLKKAEQQKNSPSTNAPATGTDSDNAAAQKKNFKDAFDNF